MPGPLERGYAVGRMQFRTWPVAALGLVGLLALIAVFGVTGARKADAIYRRLDALNTHHREVDATLRRLRSDVHLSGLLVRDYLLDTERARDPEYREQLAAFRRSNTAALADLRALLAPGTEEVDRAAFLQANLDGYWETY